MAVVSKVIEVCLWRDLNDPSNVFEKDNYSYSATMYVKKGISQQPEKIALEVLEVLQDASAEDRYYAKERMQQPKDAVGMPQRIADLDYKKWMRSSRLEEEQEDHQQRLRREMEEMQQRDQLNSTRHLQTLEHRQDLAKQAIDHNADSHWQGMQFRSLQQDQTLRHKDQQLDYQLEEVVATHRLKHGLNQQVQYHQLEHDSRAANQKLGALGNEQFLRLDSAQAQQQLRLGGIRAENTLKTEHEVMDLAFKAQRSMIDREDLDHKMQHMTILNADKVATNDRLEDIARNSQQRKNDLDESGRRAQLEYQDASDVQRLRTEGSMNQYRQENSDNTIRTQRTLSDIDSRTMQNKHSMLENERQNQARFNIASDRQRLNTLQSQGMIQNRTLQERGQIENENLSTRHNLLQENRDNEFEYTRNMGYQRIENERGMGQQRIENEGGMGQQRLLNERAMGQQRIQNEQGIGQQRFTNQQAMNNLNRAKLQDNLQAQQAGNNLNRNRLMDNLQAQRAGAAINHARHVDDARFRNRPRLQ